MQSNSEIVEAWGRDKMAEALGVPKETVRSWQRLDTLPKEYWKDILRCAPPDMAISPGLLIDLAARN